MKKILMCLFLAGTIGLSINFSVFAKDKTPNSVFEPTNEISDNTKNDSKESIANPLYPSRYTPEYIKEIKKQYSKCAKDEVFIVALDILTGTVGDYSKNAILGKNLSNHPVKVQFKDLQSINPAYADFDAVGWKQGSKLLIFVNEKHREAPAIAMAALLAHEAIHQDEYNSLKEETYAWTMEAAVWTELTNTFADYEIPTGSLVERENTLKKMFVKGNYSDEYVKKAVYSNEAYKDLPEISPGFEKL